MDQRICIKFCVKKYNKVCEMLIKAYGKSAMSKTRVYEWYKRFQDGREDVEDDERPGRPSTSTTDENVEKVKEMVMNNRRLTVREVADDVGISIGSCHEIFSNVLGMKRVAAKFHNISLLVREFLAKNNTLKAIPKIEFEKCFEDWKKRWHKCIISNGDYFKSDNINVDE
ncbi:PREDICTED: putative uncharacterized protein FLJ37770 [Dinoponera quadriceps]|uniref:Uncharacterized protein n=1 Tax=Dinoponera quadriceps TaxID=609295 RepID=A0A6P3XPL6_DINQU|nr:PREDICTED: putative uncharacterized protein FLJ37770 [Dinoponera quadriceps]